MIRLLLAFVTAVLLPSLSYAETSATAAPEIFNGQDLSGWTYVLSKPDVAMDEVWSIEEGVLKCTGSPAGYLRTESNEYENYKLTLEWRWPAKPGNNGVLVHTSTPDELGVWPNSLEVQLAHENAGDFWVIGTEIDVENEAKRVQGRRHLNLTNDSEKPAGEWNSMEIVCDGAKVTVKVNGELVNQGTNSTVTKGAICLQSEGAPIEYRNLKLAPLDE